MQELLQKINELKTEMQAFPAADEKSVEEFRIKYLGTKGIVKTVMG